MDIGSPSIPAWAFCLGQQKKPLRSGDLRGS
jgi:hypothetical protein